MASSWGERPLADLQLNRGSRSGERHKGPPSTRMVLVQGRCHRHVWGWQQLLEASTATQVEDRASGCTTSPFQGRDGYFFTAVLSTSQDLNCRIKLLSLKKTA